MQEDFRCKKCGSSQTRFRVKTNDRICYVCGNSWNNKENIEEEKEEGVIYG